MSATETADRNRAAFLEGERRREARRGAFAAKYPMLTVECPECHGEGIVETLITRPWSVSRTSDYCHVCQGMQRVTEEYADAREDFERLRVSRDCDWPGATHRQVDRAMNRLDAARDAMREEVKLASNAAGGMTTGEEARFEGSWL